jgi:SAM-dependent methyltransferase
MLRDARRAIGPEDTRFTYQAFDCHQIPYPENSFDLVIANHLLFYCKDIPQAISEVHRVLKPGGAFVCSTYSANHMKEISQLVKNYDNRISLSADILYDRFGLNNGYPLLHPYFEECLQSLYPDELIVTQPEPLIEYILSCHGNQNQYILDNYKDFRTYVEKKTKHGFHITKEAGIFICKKQIE